MFRILLVILLLFPCGALSQQTDPIPPNQGNATPQEPTADPIEIRVEALDSIQQSVEAIASNTTPDNQAQQDQTEREVKSFDLSMLDLDAQQQMAKYTRLIYLVTAAGLVVGTLTIFALGISIFQTKSIVRQDRAWITFTQAKVVLYGFATDDECAEILMRWENTGRSPAVNLIWDRQYDLPVEGKEVDDFDDMTRIIDEYKQGIGVVLASNKSNIISIRLTGEELRQILRKERSLRTHVRFVYDDIYKHFRSSEMRQIFTFNFTDEDLDLNAGVPRGREALISFPWGTKNTVT